MSEEQIKQYYERIEKLLNGANKETYGFAPEEIRQILKWYEYLKQERNQFKEYTNHNYDKAKKYKEVIDKAINDIDLVIELIKQQPTEDDSWILGRLNAFKIILKEVECENK